MAHPDKRQVAADLVGRVVEKFLKWMNRHWSANAYRWYLGYLQQFTDSLPTGLTVSQLKPFHLQTWADERSDSSSSTKRACIITVKRALSWAESQGYVERKPVAFLDSGQRIG